MTRIALESRDGLALEAELDEAEDARATLVFCHPHPKMGGTMNAPLILALRDHLVPRGWNFLRFNFRGLGESEGEHSTGKAEVADAQGALDLARETHPSLPVSIAGWSFGAAVALRALTTETDVSSCVAIAPAIKAREDITAGSPDPEEIGGSTRTLLIVGANDHLVEPQDVKTWADTAGAEYLVMEGANHFFWAKYDALAEAISRFLEEDP